MEQKNKFICACIVFAILGIVLPVVNTEEVSFINASNITSTGLTPNSGNNTTLISEMNNGYWEGNETNSNPFYIDIEFHNVTSFDAVDFTSRYFSSSGTPSTHEVELMIWCTIHNSFMEMKDYHNEPDWYSRTYYIADSGHYIQSNGTVSIRIQHLSNGNDNHRIWIDVARLIVQPKFRTDTNIFNNYTNISSGADNVSLNQKVNKSGDTMTGNLYMTNHIIYNVSEIETSSSSLTITGLNSTTILASNFSGGYNYIDMDINEVHIKENLDMTGGNITNCINCWNNNSNHNQKTVSSNYNLTTDDETIFINTTSDLNITLPTAIDNHNIYNIKCQNCPTAIDQSMGGTGSSGSVYNFIICNQYTAPQTAGVTNIYYNFVSSNGLSSVGVYSDLGNAPYLKIANSSNITAVAGFTRYPITYNQIANTKYWTCVQESSTAKIYYNYPGTRYYFSTPFTIFPSQFPTSNSTDTGAVYNTIISSGSNTTVYSTLNQTIDGNLSVILQSSNSFKLRLQSDNSNWWII